MINSLSKADIYKKEKIIYKNLIKYNQSQEKLYQYKIKNLMFHKKSHYTSVFIEYLIYDDYQEFLFELYPLNYCLPNMVSCIKMQYRKSFIPMVINEWGRNLIKINSVKKLILKNKSKDNDDTRYIFKKKYSNILPSDLSDYSLNEKEDMIDSFRTYRKFMNTNNNQFLNTNTNRSKMNKINTNEKDSQNICQTQENDKIAPVKGKECNESESTIDNVNANNDISISLDLKINKIYDDKLLTQNMEFVEGKNEKNDIELLKMLKYLKPINTAYIYQNNQNSKYKSKNKTNNIYLDYVNNKKYRMAESLSKNKSEKKTNLNVNKERLKTLININNMNKNSLYYNTNSQKNKAKNILINGRYNANEKNLTKKNNKLNSNSNNKVNNSSKHNHNNIDIRTNNITNNYNIISRYNELNNKAISPKANTSHKNKSENKPEIKKNRNKKNDIAFIISQHNLGVKLNIVNNNEQKAGHDQDKKKKHNQKEIKSNLSKIQNDESKSGKIKPKKYSEDNSIQIISVPQKLISNSRDKQIESIKNNNINSINNINILGEGEIKVFKRNNNSKLLDFSDTRKIKLFTSIKDENKASGRKKSIKKEKSLDFKPFNTNVNSMNKSGTNQSSKKKNVKRKTSDGINNFH